MKFYQMLFNNAADARHACIGILGGGGKTSLLHRLGQELAPTHRPILLSSLTKDGISAQQTVHYFADILDEETQARLFKSENPVYIMDSLENEHKLLGLNETQLAFLVGLSDVTIFECDGARKRPIKAHQPFDPAIPHFATHTIIVVGAEAVGARIESKHVHRPELFRELWDVKSTYELEPEFIAKVLTSQYGYMQKVPIDVKVAYLVNKADRYPDEATRLAKAISRVTQAPVCKGSLEQGQLERIY